MPITRKCDKGQRYSKVWKCKVPCKSPMRRDSKTGGCKWSRSSAMKKAAQMRRSKAARTLQKYSKKR